MSYYSKPDSHGKTKTKVELGLHIYATKTNVEKSVVNYTSKLAKNVDLTSLKSVVDTLDIAKI